MGQIQEVNNVMLKLTLSYIPTWNFFK